MDETLGASLLLASLYRKKPENYVLLSSNLYTAQRSYEFLLNFLGEDHVIFFPADELLRAESLTSSQELMAQRLYAMGESLKPGKKILIAHPASAMRFLPNPESFRKAMISLKAGDEVDVGSLRERLTELGYHKVNKIDQTLEFAIRGDIIDVYSVNMQKPIRIELFGDEVESIRSFDIATQRSTEELKEVEILPATDIFLSDEELTSFATRFSELLDKDCATLKGEDAELLRQNGELTLERFVSRAYQAAMYRHYGYAIGHAYSILDYLNPAMVFLANKDGFIEGADRLRDEAWKYFQELHLARLIPTHMEEYMTLDQLLKDKAKLRYGATFQERPDDLVFKVSETVGIGSGLASVVPTALSYESRFQKTVISLGDAHQRKAVMGALQDAGIACDKVRGFNLPDGKLGISDLPLNQGFEIPSAHVAYLSANDLFGTRVANTRFSARFKEATILKTYDELNPGDYVVHEYSGIGQFLGIKTLESDGKHRDYLHIAYAGDEYLYVPLEQFRLVRKYAGREGATPKLSRLGGKEWSKRKEKIKERVNDLADRLLALYRERTNGTGFAFPKDDENQKRFEDNFPYPLTADQQRSLNEIKEDMEKPDIMDRLLCGDVGFGKTEIALRAAFKAILAGKQVALLCPTTLLARQHFEVALARFEGFPVNICMLSRLVSSADQSKAIEAIEKGKMDLVIGTHRLLSKDVKFRDLGFLIIDEEQRFGVEQKEKIKELKSSIDVLSLSATPIPRTMQMSLVGLRPLSEINTAPEARMPIQTYVTPYKESTVAELITRELSRNGQVFYVHNNISSIYFVAARLAGAIPGAKIGVIHGKMEKEDVEEVMSKFYENEINVLVCTSIVENGIDVPNANMIIVEDADRFGLAQLYQIKGRVGRGNRIAYAYLTYKPNKNMDDDARKRLKAIQEFTELGSGYRIAQRDLLIRGAGDILGPEQAGFIDSIGLDLYLKMLNEAIESKKTGVAVEPPKPKKLFDIDAYIPAGYAIPGDKLELYQELEEISSEKELSDWCDKLRDVYGKIPKETELLINKKRIDLYIECVEFQSVEDSAQYVDIFMADIFSRINGIGNELFDALVTYLPILHVSYSEKRLRMRLAKHEEWMDDLRDILRRIHALYERHMNQGGQA